ncbi:hypothetical protein SAMN04244573_00072 [Azotobacter beijerinckii]|uniref:Uncharacterized protein n=1 Tax=Azotobacter beijerinckii TaxID=170623 RepID=A0A1H8YZL5_9GAMM|nr:hypothetical protein [Azotobacter beijerinckii]SEP57521.1 hypothetical protein SAMN04244573_00072 [Azotobacter beijerinckii]
MERFLKLVVLVVGIVLGQAAFAVDYYWSLATQSLPGTSSIYGLHYSSPQAACSATEAAYSSPSWTATGSSLSFVSLTSYLCTLNLSASNGSTATPSVSISRGGSICSSGTTYNSSTGLCDVPPAPICTTGQSKDFLINSANGSLPTSLVSEGCVYNIVNDGENFFCQSSTTGTGFVCAVEAKGTGESNTGPVTDAPVAEVTEKPTIDITDQPCIYETAADGTQSCTSSKEVSNTGKYCGTVNGQQVCIGESTSKTDTVDTTISTSSNPNGSTTQTKTDVYTKEGCTGVSCTTSKTTTTKTTVTDSSGNVLSTSGQCSGSSCSTDSNSDQDGDGLEDCAVTDTCERNPVLMVSNAIFSCLVKVTLFLVRC